MCLTAALLLSGCWLRSAAPPAQPETTVSEGAKTATHTYIEIEPSGMYQALGPQMIDTRLVITTSLAALPVPLDAAPHWVIVDSASTPAAKRSLLRLADEAASHRWQCIVRVGSKSAAAPGGDPVRIVVGTNGVMQGAADCTNGRAVVLAYTTGVQTAIERAFDLAASGCTVTTTISASSPASTPVPAAP